MSFEERRLMRRVDEAVLGATPERLVELQRLDEATQLSGTTFYEHVVAAGALPARGRRA
ncbi:MAG: hypothetical protein OXU86_03365 [Thaumarchaeota archaeon]|nr:hypothetical protein [Nitrososphaerota archaeon]MDD9809991.1 hypothetical protein [Nitrososphaerota archaeon]MDD9813150.1 hypothetical protein [Nitrososphaerota archaeon]MDD9825799.1 hypothetical protein [Nitrososphaerota archaeon]MDD9843472.1 hypothetical protein [Nitrososphaerota archaeon]